jgi:hypothetical protein
MATLVAYAAITDVLPDDTSLLPFEQWSMTDAPGVPANSGTTTAAVTGGILHIEDPDEGARRIYARYDTLNSMDNAIFEINCKVISTDPAPGLTDVGNGVGFGFIDTAKSLEVKLFDKRPEFGEGSISIGDIAAVEFPTTDKFHTYRIVKNGNVNMEVWADGNKVLDILYKDLTPRTTEFPGDQREVFSTSGSELSKWDIAYVSYSISP